MLVFVLSVSVLLILHGECCMKATVTLYGDMSAKQHGNLTLIQNNPDAPVHIIGEISGLNISSAHGFHIHTNPVSDGFPNCTAAGVHFNPFNTKHGSRTSSITNRHVGDLGNITTDVNGKAMVNINDTIIELYSSRQTIINRSVVVHLFRDDAGLSENNDSVTTGNAGPRVLCGLIKNIDTSHAINVKPMALAIFIMMTMGFIQQIYSTF